MYAQEIREKFAKLAGEAEAYENGQTTKGTPAVIRALAEIAAQLAEQNVHLATIEEYLQSK